MPSETACDVTLTVLVMDIVHVVWDMHYFVADLCTRAVVHASTIMNIAFGRGLDLGDGTAAATHVR